MTNAESHYGIQETAAGLVWKGCPVTNFEILDVRPLVSPQDLKDADWLVLNIRSASEKCSEIVVSVSQPICTQIEKAVSSCKILKDSARKALDAYIIEIAQKQSSNRKKLCFCATGLWRLPQGNWVFVSGDEVLGDYGDAGYCLAPTVPTVHLAWNPRLNEREALCALLTEFEKHKNTLWPVFAFTLLSSLRSRLISLGLSTFPALYLYGQPGFGKTVLANWYCLLYDEQPMSGRVCGKLDASSTLASVRQCGNEYRNMVVLIDDLAKGSDPYVERQRRQLITGVLRYAANDTSRSALGNSQRSEKLCCQAGVVFTGEIPLRGISDIERLILVNLKEPVRGGSRHNREIAATVFRGWMLWLLPQLDHRLHDLQEQIDTLSSEARARTHTTKVLLLWVLNLFYEYAVQVKCVSEHYAEAAMRVVQEVIGQMLAVQEEMVQRSTSPAPAGNLSYYIHKGYHEQVFLIVEKKRLKKERECIVDKGCLCIRLKTLLLYFQTQTPYRSISEKKLYGLLEQEGLVDWDSSHRGPHKKINGKKYMEISLSRLQDTIVQY